MKFLQISLVVALAISALLLGKSAEADLQQWEGCTLAVSCGIAWLCAVLVILKNENIDLSSIRRKRK